MTDHDKLEAIERICRESFSQPDTLNVDLYRAQALANVYGIILYDGATIANIHEAVSDYIDSNQISFDDILNTTPTIVDEIKEAVKAGKIREEVTISDVAQLKHRIDLARHTGIHEIFPMEVRMSKLDCHELLGLLGELDTNEITENILGYRDFMGVPIRFTEEHGIRLTIETEIKDELQ